MSPVPSENAVSVCGLPPVPDPADSGGVPAGSIAGSDFIRGLLDTSPPSCNERFLLRAEAWLLRLAYSHNKMLSLSNSRTRILAHQVECTHRIVNSLNRRFLIADEVGLGKTIEAGLVIKELEYRHGYRRVLIVCPASLLLQWQQEMRSKFNEEFTVLDRHEMRRLLSSGRSVNPWEVHDRIICSIDFIKNKRCLRGLQHVSWDAVIFDEAHRLRRDSRRATLAYEAARRIAGRTRALLLLTATPFRGRLEELYYLVSLLDPNILGPFQSFYFDYCLDGSDLSTLREIVAPVLIRRTKREVGGFTRRCARTVRFEFYPDERVLYNETTRYVAEEYNRALRRGNNTVGFVMTIFQKLLDSSTHALACALGRRRGRLSDLLSRAPLERLLGDDGDGELIHDDEDVDGLIGGTHASSPEEIRAEIATLDRLIRLAAAVREDKKAGRLARLIRDLRNKGHRKFLVFTQFRTTQEYLARVLSDFDVELFHGSLGREEKERAIGRFRDGAEILISTEAGGEGRNMQFCNILVNYDLPWSPLKIEQRIGRLHRFGQAGDVFIYNFATKETVAERVLAILSRKLRLFEESIGMPDVLLGDMEDELRLDALFMEMAAGLRSRDSMEDEVERRMARARLGYDRMRELAVSDRMDFNYDDYYRVTLAERNFSNRRIERFVEFLSGIDTFAARMVLPPDRNGLRPVLDGDAGGACRPGTFDSARALENEELEFLAFGHPVIDRMVARCLSPDFGGFTGVLTVRGRVRFTGMVFYYMVTFSSAFETREVMPVVVAGQDVPRALIDEIESGIVVRPIENAAVETEWNEEGNLILEYRDRYFAAAAARLGEKIGVRKRAIADRQMPSIDPEVEKIRYSYGRRIAELEEKADLLEAQHKWYGRNLRGAITRTRNLIAATQKERDALFEQFSVYRGLTHSVELLCAGVLVSRP